MIKELDVTKIFHEFTMRNIILAEEVNSVNSVRLLYVSIFVCGISLTDAILE